MSTSFIARYGTQLPLSLPEGEVWGSEEMLQSVGTLYTEALEHFHLASRTLTEIGKIYEKVIMHHTYKKSMRRQEMESQASVIDLMRRISASNSLSVDVQPISPAKPLKRKESLETLNAASKKARNTLCGF